MLVSTGLSWWAVQGSNLRPLPCEGDTCDGRATRLPQNTSKCELNPRSFETLSPTGKRRYTLPLLDAALLRRG